MLAEYIGVGIVFGLSLAMAGALLGLQRRSVAHDDRPHATLDEAAGDGDAPAGVPVVPAVPPVTGAHEDGCDERRRVALSYERAALLFPCLIAAVFFCFPWAAGLRGLGEAGFFAFGLFVLPVAVGFLYAWTRGAFEWR